MLEFITETEHKARKAHECFLCDRKIEPGENYTRRTYKYDGDFCNECYHSTCWSVLNAYWTSAWIDDTWDAANVREWLEEEYCRACLGEDEDLAECEVPVFRCRKIIEKIEEGRRKAVLDFTSDRGAEKGGEMG